MSAVLLVADHASAAVPPEIDLGIPLEWLTEHIAVDLGSAALTARLQAMLACPAVIATVSRLVIDLNREPERVDLVPERSDGRIITGNVGLTAAERQRRIRHYHMPYHAEIEAAVTAHRPELIISLHSFTPALASRDEPRPWPVGLLYNRDERAAKLGIAALQARGIDVGDNQPYSGRDLNYTMNRHAEDAGIAYLGFEVRQDQLGDNSGIEHWANLLAGTIDHVRLTLAGDLGQDRRDLGESA